MNIQDQITASLKHTYLMWKFHRILYTYIGFNWIVHILMFLMACKVFSLTLMRDGWCIVEISLESILVKKYSNSVTQMLPKVAFLLLDLGFSLVFFLILAHF